jgi:hypothetical protein
MAWTAPMTFADGNALTAAQLNAQLRDNLNETMVAKAQTAGAMFFGDDVNSLVERVPVIARVEAFENTTSTTYTDLTNFGPSVTLDTGTNALVFIAAEVGNNTANAQTSCSYEVSGATTIAADASWGITTDGLQAATSSNYLGMCITSMRDDLTPGSNTFTMKYRCASGTGSFIHRCIIVWPL